MSRPARSGADPCTGSKRPAPSPRLADGSSPSDPQTAPASSDRMSPNMFSVSSTSNDAGASASFIAAVSTNSCVSVTPGKSRAISVTTVAPEPRDFEHVGLVDRDEAAAPRSRKLERHPRDALDLVARIAQRVHRRLAVGVDAARLAVVEAAGQLANDHHVGAREHLWLERSCVSRGRATNAPAADWRRRPARGEWPAAPTPAAPTAADRRTPDRRRRRAESHRRSWRPSACRREAPAGPHAARGRQSSLV